ncbi:MAG: response regulator [Lachnospiraceae bacterium]|nr:response regulator [Lachnospiraceae bacterium]
MLDKEKLKKENKVSGSGIKNFFMSLRQSIFVGERLERNLKAITAMGVVVSIGGFIMTLLNIFQKKGFVTLTTAAIIFFGLFIVYGIKVLRNRRLVSISIFVFSLAVFAYYSISGVNEGFAILWTLLMPVAISFLIGALYGISLSAILEVLFIVLFWTPIRAQMAPHYTETFMNRFPLLYLVGIFLNLLAVSSYHISTLSEIEYEKRLKEAAEAAIAADKAKSRFLAQMSHEIRTPINAVLGMNEMIIREAGDEVIRDYADDIQVAGKNLLSIINTILDFSKIEDGKMEIIPVEYDLASVLNNLINSIAARAKAKHLDFNVDVDESLPVTLYGDDVRVSQVVINLLTNAVKYTETGSIRLSIKEVSRDEENILIETCVSDTGIGIRSEDMDKLFESFGRLDEKRNRGIEGTGLGMAIVVKLLEMMDSTLKVESEYGKGSSFSFVLKQKIVNPEPVGDYTERFVRSSRQVQNSRYLYAPEAKVLVVDDNEMNCKVAGNLMKKNGIVPDFAFSGEECIDKIRNRFYHIVFLDHMMPKMDGIETLQILRERNLIPDGMKIIVLTANAVVGAKDNYLEAGFDDYLSKPIEIDELEEKLAKFLPEELAEWKRDGREDEVLEFKPPEGEVMEFAPSDDGVMEFAPSDDRDILEFSPADDADRNRTDSESTDELVHALEEMGLDTEAALRYCAGDKIFYREMTEEFISTSATKSVQLENYHKAMDLKEYKTLVHSIKSSAKTIGAGELSEEARKLETASAEGNSEYVKAHHDEFIGDYFALCGEMKTLLNRYRT